MHESTWSVLGKSVRGASHERARLPNQDAMRWWPNTGLGPPLLLAVSDGHGSPRSFRSDRGARMAVEAVEAALRSFLESEFGQRDLRDARRWAEERLPRDSVRRWTDAVADDLSSKPFTSKEIARLQQKEGAGKHREVVLNPVVAYGATILSVAVTESLIIYQQLGDGDILTVSEAGDVFRPLPKDERLIANETTSLCMEKAWCEFRVAVQTLEQAPPALILISTDGYANAFKSDEDFLKAGPDILGMIRKDGLEQVDRRIEPWLNEMTRFSGDDITLGILCRVTAIRAAVRLETAGALEAPAQHAAGQQPESTPELTRDE